MIEGVGGVMAPMTEDRTVLDWIKVLDAPAVLVGGSYLGAMSHLLTAKAVLDAAGIAIAAIVISESTEENIGLDPTVASLAPFVGDASLYPVPRITSATEPWRDAPPLREALPPAQ